MHAAMALMLMTNVLAAPAPAALSTAVASPRVGSHLTFDTAASTNTPSPRRRSSRGRKGGLFVQAGFESGGGQTGWIFGAGAVFRGSSHFDILADFNLLRESGSNLWYFSFNGRYIVVPNNEHVLVLIGAGIGVLRVNHFNTTKFQVLFGLDFPGKPAGVEVRLFFLEGSTTIIGLARYYFGG